MGQKDYGQNFVKSFAECLFCSSYVEPWLIEGGFGENRQIEITVKVEENHQPRILASGTIQLGKKILGNPKVTRSRYKCVIVC